MVLSKLLSDGVENGFPPLGKAAQDQHRFRGDRVDDFADRRVIKQQVNELSYLDAVDLDYGLFEISDVVGSDHLLTMGTVSYDHVLLFCAIIRLYIPN
jgi:hypothetical protein